MTSIVTACVAGYDRKTPRQDIDDLAFALIAPLRAYNNRSPASAQIRTPRLNLRLPSRRAGRTHLLSRVFATEKMEVNRTGCVRNIIPCRPGSGQLPWSAGFSLQFERLVFADRRVTVNCIYARTS